MQKILCFLLPLMSLLFIQSKAQSFGQKTSIGIMGGISGYSGSMPKTLTQAAFSINMEYEMTDNFHLRFQALATETGGSDPNLNNAANNGNDTRSSTYYFATNINEFSLTPEYNFFNLNDGAKFTPYVLAGIGFYNFKPYQVVQITRPNGTIRDENLEMQKVTNYSNWQINVPVAVGVKYALSPNVFLNAEGSYRFLFNPYLDNYAKDNKNDKYYTIMIGIGFRLSPITARSNNLVRGRNCKCPPVY